jgi:DNA-binding MarR family transcriptional regulator
MLLNQKPVSLLIRLLSGSSYGGKLSREIDTTYSHTVKIIDQLEDKDLIEKEPGGRKKILSLTDKGREKAEALRDLVEAGGENQQ